MTALATSHASVSGTSVCWWHHQQIALIRRARDRPRWWRSMSRMRAFHDSMRLFVGGIGSAHPSGGSRNVNSCPSLIRLRTIRRALARRMCRSATVPCLCSIRN
nr:MAG TPA: hypothetical protein [Caudoviricetes sp.]